MQAYLTLDLQEFSVLNPFILGVMFADWLSSKTGEKASKLQTFNVTDFKLFKCNREKNLSKSNIKFF